MVTGIVLVNVERAQLNQVIDSFMAIQGVTEVYAVAGEYDLVVMIRVPDNNALAEIVTNKMTRDISGITRAKTLVTMEAKAKVDLNSVFC